MLSGIIKVWVLFKSGTELSFDLDYKDAPDLKTVNDGIESVRKFFSDAYQNTSSHAYMTFNETVVRVDDTSAITVELLKEHHVQP
jgi:hypothetical protein